MADVNYQSYYGVKGTQVIGTVLPAAGVEPKNYSDILKFSICEDTQVSGCTIYCGKENCIDAVRGSNYKVDGCTLNVRGPSLGAFTIKGAIDGFVISNCAFDQHGDKFDIELGQYDDYWYPGRPPTKRVLIINNKATDGKPLKVTVWDADIPSVTMTNVEIVQVPWIVWFPYFFFKYLKRKIFG